MDFIKLTKCENRADLFVRASAVNSVTIGEYHQRTKVYMAGDPVAFEVTQSIEKVIELVREVEYASRHKE